MNKISIITPSFNQGQFLEETILSVLNQNYSNLEYIVIDGGSSDNSIEVIKKYQNHLSYWTSEKDGGQSEAINKGLKKCTGDIITWINSDDILLPNALKNANELFISKPQIDVLHGETILFNSLKEKKTTSYQASFQAYQYLAFMRFPQPSSFFRRSVLENCGYLNEDLSFAMDYEFFCKAILLQGQFQYSNNYFSKYRIHTHSKSNTMTNFLDEWMQVLINILYSLNFTNTYLKRLEEHFRIKPNQQYICRINLSESEIKEMVFLHLNMRYHQHYQALQRNECIALSKFIKLNFEKEYHQNKYTHYNTKLKLLPKFVYELRKKFSSSL